VDKTAAADYWMGLRIYHSAPVAGSVAQNGHSCPSPFFDSEIVFEQHGIHLFFDPVHFVTGIAAVFVRFKHEQILEQINLALHFNFLTCKSLTRQAFLLHFLKAPLISTAKLAGVKRRDRTFCPFAFDAVFVLLRSSGNLGRQAT
jgi:hypothetical protein